MNREKEKVRQAIQRAIDLAEGQTALANLINRSLKELGLTKVQPVDQQNIWRWRDLGQVPTEYGIPIEHALKHRVTRHQVCPGKLPRSSKQDAAASEQRV